MIAVGRHLLDSTVFALLVGMICWYMGRRAPATRYTLWLIAVAKFAVPTAVFLWAGERLRGLLPAVPTRSLLLPAALSRWVTYSAVSGPSASAPSPWFDPLVLFWLAGSAVALGLWLPRLRTSRNSSECAGALEERAFVRLKELVGLRQHAELRFSARVREPLLAGFFSPAVMIPSGLVRELSPAELDSLILHELSHAKRFDNWTAAFAHAVTCVFWFYPLLWWIEKRLHAERELACDQMVVRSGAAPDDYFAGILKSCRFFVTREVRGVTAVSGANLEHRKEQIMSFSSKDPLRRSPKAVLATLLALATGVPLAVGLLTTNAATTYAQDQNDAKTATKQAESQKTITCAFASVRYPEGAVVQEAGGPEQMCVRVNVPIDPSNIDAGLKYVESWVVTTDAARQRTATVIHLPAPKPFYCTPDPPNGGSLCTCEGGGTFSPGGRANSAKGPFQLRCKNGSWVETKTPNKRD